MVEIEVGEFSRGRRRVDAVTAASLVLTVDAALFLVIAVLGVPFLLFVFGDEDGTWHRMWPLVTSKYKNYAGYQVKTSREIPLVLLEPVSG